MTIRDEMKEVLFNLVFESDKSSGSTANDVDQALSKLDELVEKLIGEDKDWTSIDPLFPNVRAQFLGMNVLRAEQRKAYRGSK